jgi:hypothetical protein
VPSTVFCEIRYFGSFYNVSPESISPIMSVMTARSSGTAVAVHDVFTIVRSKLPYTKEVLVAVGAEIGLAIVDAEVDLATAPASPPHPMTELPKRR